MEVKDKVDVIVTDSPLMLSTIYNNNPVLGEDFNNVVRNVAKSFNTKNYYIWRVKPYNPIGRNQTEAESDAIADEVRNMLETEGIEYLEYPGMVAGYDDIVQDILKIIKK